MVSVVRSKRAAPGMSVEKHWRSEKIKSDATSDSQHPTVRPWTSKIVLMVVLVAGVLADKKPLPDHFVAIVHREQHHPDETGAHSFDFEAENGIKIHVSGSQGATGGANSIGSWSYPMEDGRTAELKFVADEFGYQPESDLLPVPPEFPHEIPDYVLRQIAKAERERQALKDKST